MKRIIVTREKNIASALMLYWVIPGSKQAFMQQFGLVGDLTEHDAFGQPLYRIDIAVLDANGARIKNGEQIALDLNDSIFSVFACTRSGSLSNEVYYYHSQRKCISPSCPLLDARIIVSAKIKCQLTNQPAARAQAKPSADGNAAKVSSLRSDNRYVQYPRTEGHNCVNVARVWRSFLFGVQEPFLFSGKSRKEKWVLRSAAKTF